MIGFFAHDGRNAFDGRLGCCRIMEKRTCSTGQDILNGACCFVANGVADHGFGAGKIRTQALVVARQGGEFGGIGTIDIAGRAAWAAV